MTATITVLGAGMVGSVIAEDLNASGFRVSVADVNNTALSRISERSMGAIGIHHIDCADAAAVTTCIESSDVVVGALPSWLGLQTLQTVIESKKPYCDISFMAEDPRELHELACSNGVPCVVDFGVAPGMSHLLCAHIAATLDSCSSLDIVVGGLPVERKWPWEYKAPFSPRDVIEEYIRPARIVEHGKVTTKPALSEVELIELPGVGTLEAFNSDGLRTLCDTLSVPNIRERTLRYPGHAEMMKRLRDSGFFSGTPIQCGGQTVVPLDMTAKILIESWKYEPREADLTVMRVSGEGVKGDTQVMMTYDLIDYYDGEADQSSMARTTGFPAASIARMLVDGTICTAGVHPPESFGGNTTVVQRILSELEERHVLYTKTMEPIQ